MSLPTSYQHFIHASRYARWLEKEQRRETWEETVTRLLDFWKSKGLLEDGTEREQLENSILTLEVMPSMRALMTAGAALDRDNAAGYNCSYLAINRVRAFDEAMYILLCGTGVGYSVEQKYVNQLPEVAETFHDTESTIVVSDSKIGWASSFRELISLLYAGKLPRWDLSRIRPAGAILKTFGGRASGPGPLNELFEFSVRLFKRAAGRKLTTVEAHDLMCKIAEIVVVGGVRRSALISLSDLEDGKMRVAKSGAWWEEFSHRALANNSVVYKDKPTMHEFMEEWKALYESKSGERGIFNRAASEAQSERNGRRVVEGQEFGTNPCSEIILRDRQFCNLTEVIVRPTDSLAELQRKVRIATILGTLQSTLTDFRYLGKKWKENTEEERLLGVSFTGIMDHPVMSGCKSLAREAQFDLEEWLISLVGVAIETNKEWAAKLGINESAAITCVKPSGTVSQLVDSASGIHPRYSSYYIRTVRADNKDPLTQFLKEQGVPFEPDLRAKESTTVFSFPMKAPEGALLRDDVKALQQLELWKIYQEHWCEHKPSITVYVREDEWLEVGAWVYKNFNILSGVSFLPYDNGVYKQAPYQEITKDVYEKLVEQFPRIDWKNFIGYESSDTTTVSHELACSAGHCEI